MILFEIVIKSEFTYGSSIILDNVFELISWKYSVIHEQKCKKNSELLLWITISNSTKDDYNYLSSLNENSIFSLNFLAVYSYLYYIRLLKMTKNRFNSYRKNCKARIGDNRYFHSNSIR